MGHPIVVVRSDVGDPSKGKSKQQIPFGDDNKKSKGQDKDKDKAEAKAQTEADPPPAAKDDN
jgi:hypothetical protein